MSDDFEGSDLTDLDDEPYTQESNTASQKKKKATKPSEDSYKVRGALRAPRTITLSAGSLYEQLHANDINLDAEYQRGKDGMIAFDGLYAYEAFQILVLGLIDSLFRNFYIPPVIFSATELPDGTSQKVCIDGKQRLTSIWRCHAVLTPLLSRFTNEKFFFKELPDRKEKGKLLPERYRKIFVNKQLVCMEYSDMTDSDEREVFQRVQLGMALTPAEKLQAVHSDASVFLHELQQEYVNDRLADHLEWDITRAADFRCLSTAVYILEKTPTTTSPGIATVHKWLEESEAFSHDFAERVHQTLRIFVWLAEDQECSHCFNLEKEKKKLKVSPLEFVATVVLIHQHNSKATLRQLSDAIRKMRLDVRSVEQDIRLNSRCMRIVMTFIKTLKVSQLKADPDEETANVAIKKLYKPKPKLDDDSDREVEAKSPKKSLAKRKREFSDDEYQPQKPIPTQRTSKIAVKASPPRTADLGGRGQSLRSSQTARPISAPTSSAKPLVTQPPAPHTPAPSLPPPPTEPRMHPDRLAALREAKTGVAVPSYVPPQRNGHFDPNSPAYPLPNSPFSSYQSRWQDSTMVRTGLVIPTSDVGPPPLSSDSRAGFRDAPWSSSSGIHQPAGSTVPNRPVSYARDEKYDRSYNDRYPGARYAR
ncbi:hypothetical protein BC835DRAFT_1468970 [Cytidiella melzeri]|nr:hypothetical protein BC835DRAFT_1468970 [Cytidiella melzeri]